VAGKQEEAQQCQLPAFRSLRSWGFGIEQYGRFWTVPVTPNMKARPFDDQIEN